jgi:hypothetical protein
VRPWGGKDDGKKVGVDVRRVATRLPIKLVLDLSQDGALLPRRGPAHLSGSLTSP